MMMWYGGGGWWMFLMWLVPIGIIALIVWTIVDRRDNAPAGGAERGTSRAEAIVRERFAKGEIDEEELDRILRRLES